MKNIKKFLSEIFQFFGGEIFNTFEETSFRNAETGIFILLQKIRIDVISTNKSKYLAQHVIKTNEGIP